MYHRYPGKCVLTIKDDAGNCENGADPDQRFGHFMGANRCLGPVRRPECQKAVQIDHGHCTQTDNKPGDK